MLRNAMMACVLTAVLLCGCSRNERAIARHFLDAYSTEWTRLRHAAKLADWEAHTRMMSGDTSGSADSRAAGLALVAAQEAPPGYCSAREPG